MTRLNDLHVEDIEGGDVVYRIYIDNDGSCDNPRDLEGPENLGADGVCGTLYSLEKNYNDPSYRSDKWENLSYDAKQAINEHFKPQMLELASIGKLVEKYLDEWTGDEDLVALPKHDQNQLELHAQEPLNALLIKLRPLFKDDEWYEKAADALGFLDKLTDLEDDYPMDTSECDGKDNIPIGARNLLDAANDALDQAIELFDADTVFDNREGSFSDEEVCERFFENFAHDLGWAWINLSSRTWMYGTSDELEARFKTCTGMAHEQIIAQAEEAFKIDAKVYRQWREGEVYGYISFYKNDDGTFDKNDHYNKNDREDSCWGFIGMEHITAEVKAMAEASVTRAKVADKHEPLHKALLAEMANRLVGPFYAGGDHFNASWKELAKTMVSVIGSKLIMASKWVDGLMDLELVFEEKGVKGALPKDLLQACVVAGAPLESVLNHKSKEGRERFYYLFNNTSDRNSVETNELLLKLKEE